MQFLLSRSLKTGERRGLIFAKQDKKGSQIAIGIQKNKGCRGRVWLEESKRGRQTKKQCGVWIGTESVGSKPKLISKLLTFSNLIWFTHFCVLMFSSIIGSISILF